MSNKANNNQQNLEITDEFNNELEALFKESDRYEENVRNAQKKIIVNDMESMVDSDTGMTEPETETVVEKVKRPSLASHHRSRHKHSYRRSSENHDISGREYDSDLDTRGDSSSHSYSSHHSLSHHHSDNYDMSHHHSGYSHSEHHSSSHHYESGYHSSRSEEPSGYDNESTESDSSTIGDVSKAIRIRVPLASHRRAHSRSDGKHQYSSHHRSRQHAKKSHFTGQATIMPIDMDEIASLQKEMMDKEESEQKKNECVQDEVSESSFELEKSAPRIASTIVAARGANPRETKKASAIKSAGSRRRKKQAAAFTIIIRILIGLAVFLVGGIGVLLYMRSHGQATMTPDAGEIEIVMPEEEIPEDVEKVEDEGKTITYKGQKYRWNDNITTVLFLGTDRTLEQQESGMTMAGKNGQADTILLGVIDNTNKKISFINVNRDTFVPVAEYTSDGDYAGEKKMQICLSYAYGKDDETSCQYTAAAVSKYLYGMPVNYYVRLSYDAVQVLNDSVGGVTLTVAEDMTSADASLAQGATVTLAGSQALTYIRWRNHSVVDTNEKRISRQKQYLYAFMKRTIECTRADITLPLGLYANAKPYMTTNVTTSQVTYLTSKMLEYGIADDAIHSIPGESVIGSGNHVEYYPDETALYERVLETFYNKVDSEK